MVTELQLTEDQMVQLDNASTPQVSYYERHYIDGYFGWFGALLGQVVASGTGTRLGISTIAKLMSLVSMSTLRVASNRVLRRTTYGGGAVTVPTTGRLWIVITAEGLDSCPKLSVLVCRRRTPSVQKVMAVYDPDI